MPLLIASIARILVLFGAASALLGFPQWLITGDPSSAIHVVRKSEIPPDDPLFSEEQRSHSNNRTRAVIHMGPAKTGTSTIQMLMRRMQDQLKEDGYEMPWGVLLEGGEFKPTDFHMGRAYPSQMNFAGCITHRQRTTVDCIPELLVAGTDIADRGKNLLVSAEHFGHILGTELRMLKAYLSQWDDVTIVVYHRRLYDWVVSYHNQFNKRSELSKLYTVRDEVDKLLKGKLKPATLVETLRENFREDEIVVKNFHDEGLDGKLAERFFCDALPDAPRTCEAVRAFPKPKHINKSKPMSLDYKFLVAAAQKAGLVTNTTTTEVEDKIVAAAHQHQENTLGLTNRDFLRICPSQDDLERLWEMSLAAERALFPDRFRDGGTREAAMRADFEKASTTSLCMLDTEGTLPEDTWQSFFRSLSVPDSSEGSEES